MAEITQDGHEMREVPDELPRLLRQARMNSSDNWLLETSEECCWVKVEHPCLLCL